MSSSFLIVVVAAITFASRISFLVRRHTRPPNSRFLEVFPVALFVSLAANELLAPAGDLAVTPNLAAAAGAVLGAVLFRRAILGVVATGVALYWLARLLS